MEFIGTGTSKNNFHNISKRCLRCFDEQQWYGESFLFDYIGDSDVDGYKILEIGCGWGGFTE